jgi:hypothetical protein
MGALAALAIFVFFHPIDDKVAVIERKGQTESVWGTCGKM